MTEISSKHRVYEELHRTSEFQDLRRRYRSFAIPWTIVFLSWYLLYVIASGWAHDFMSTKVVGNINIALIFGLLQFVSTFGIAWLYSRHATNELDPLAATLQSRYEQEVQP
jgi:uncharacterized membrane protein (DUF485 family)